MKLSAHFTLAELTKSATAVRLHIANTPPGAILPNLKRLAAALERVRELAGDRPLLIKSGYRSPEVNKAVGGAKNSFHLVGCAADFDPPPGVSHDTLQKAIAASGMDFDLVLEEKAKDGGHWLHFQIALPGQKPRRLVRDAELDKVGGAITRTTAG